MYLFGFSQMSATGIDHMSVLIFFTNCVFKIIFYAGKFYGRQKLAIWQVWQIVLITTYAYKFFHIAVPWSYIFITDGPVHRKPVPGRTFKVIIAPALSLSGPH